MFESFIHFFKFEKGNYRRGGLFMLPGITIGIILAYLFGDKGPAMLAIGITGYGATTALILAGNKSKF
jgi:hypothetical protein